MKQRTSDSAKQLKERLYRIVKKPKFRITAEIALLLIVVVIAGLVLGNTLQENLHKSPEEAQLVSARIAKLPYRTTYICGQEPDLAGLEMRLTYNNATREIVTEGFTVSPQQLDTCGTQTVTVGFGKFYDTFTVKVLEADKTGSCGETLQWAVADHILIITGSGEMENYSADQAPWTEYAQTISTVYLPEGLLSVGDAAFMDLRKLYEIRIPETVVTLGQGAFNGCAMLTEVTVPASVTSIKDACFCRCTNLRKLNILNPQCTIEGSILSSTGNAVIYSYANSAAIEYARENDLEFDLLD